MSTDSRIVRLWERMTALYGSRWTLDYGPAQSGDHLGTLANIWGEVLAELGNDALAIGLQRCLERESEHPPSLPEFLRLCGARPNANRPTAHREYRAPHTLPEALYADTPAQQCARLAAQLTEQAEADLTPTLKQAATLKQRANMTSAYWLSRIATTGPTGQRLVAALQAQPSAAA